MKPVEEPLGIPSSGYEYMEVSPEQSDLESKLNEFFEIQNYVLTVGERKYTMLLGQPATEFGTVRKEYENLRILGKSNKKM